MRNFTKEELERLKEAEPYFKTAVNSAYKRATTYKLDMTVNDIYVAAGGKGASNFACGVCSLNFYKRVGQKYFDEVGKELEPTKENKVDTDNKATNKKRNGKSKQTE